MVRASDRSRYVTRPAATAAAEQLALGLGRPGVDARRGARPVLPAPVRTRAARPRLAQPAGARGLRRTILRFWLDRGVDGFRIDVAHGLVKDATLADEPEPFPVRTIRVRLAHRDRPARGARRSTATGAQLVDAYDGDRVLVGEVVFSDQTRVAALPAARRAAPRVQLLARLPALGCRRASADVDRRLARDAADRHVGAREPRRHAASRRASAAARGARGRAAPARAARRRRSSTRDRSSGSRRSTSTDAARQDPIFFRSARRSAKAATAAACRCRGARRWPRRSWLPQPRGVVDTQRRRPSKRTTASMLALYRRALALRPHGGFAWRESPPGTLVFERGRAGVRRQRRRTFASVPGRSAARKRSDQPLSATRECRVDSALTHRPDGRQHPLVAGRIDRRGHGDGRNP